MSSFDSLLDATIAHVEQLRDEGVSHLSVDPDLVRALGVLKKVDQPLRSQKKAVSLKQTLKVDPVENVVPEPVSSSSPSPSLTLPAVDEPELSSEAKTAAIQHLRDRAAVCT